nr:MAG: RNA-dependent RNA polymerase [Wufeng shrew chuvirus 2]
MFLSQSGHLLSECSQLLQDHKFDTAMRKSTIDAFIKRKEKDHSWIDDLIWSHHPTADEYLQDTTLLPRLLLMLMDPTDTSFHGRCESWQEIWDIVDKNVIIQHSWISNGIKSPLNKCNNLLQELLHKFGYANLVSRLVSVLTDLNDVINHLPKINSHIKGHFSKEDLLKLKKEMNQHTIKSLDMSFTWSPKMVVIEWMKEKWLLPKPYILQMHNKIADLISILLYSIGSSGVQHPFDFYHSVVDHVKMLCRLHVTHPVAFFDVAKMLEGVCIAIILHKTEDWVNDSMLDSLLNELNEIVFFDMRSHPLIQSLLDAPIDVICELSCLSKCTGHPLVEIKEGAQKLYNRVNEPFDVSVEAISFCVSSFKESFVRNFIFKFKRWPNINVDYHTTHPAILHCYPRGLDPFSKEITERFGRLRWEDWADIELLPEMKMNYCENIIPLLKDKAISIVRSQVFNQYLKHAGKEYEHLVDNSDFRAKFQDTRVLLHYLFTSDLETNHVDYIRKFCESDDDFHQILDYLVIRLVPKEKELKLLPRFFGCKSWLDRARSAIGEYSLATFLNLFCDEQGMTLSELALIKKLYSMQNLSKLYKTHKVFKVALDAEAWNTKQRDETNTPFASHTIDPLHGTNQFKKTHKAYEASRIYVPDENGFYYWDGQKGGVEGLNQNQWVTLFIYEMKWAFRDTPYPYFQIVHGDDYRAVIAVPYTAIPPGGEADILKELKEKVANAAQAFGHKIKITESYASEHILCYSKIFFFKGIQLPSALRKIQKTYGSTNAFLPILDDYVGCSFSNAHSTCYTTVVHYIPYIVSLFWSAYYLKGFNLYSGLTKDQFVAMTLTPSVVGGLPIIYLHNFFVRGESDLLCAFVDLVKHSIKFFPSIGRLMFNFLRIPFSSKKPFSLLLKDPYSLPIKKPVSISLYLKNIVKKRLIKTVVNRDVRDMLWCYNKASLEVLIDDLRSAQEWQAKPFTALYSNSPYHLIDELLSGFVTAKSIMDLLITSSRNINKSQKILEQAIKKDHKVHLWRINVLNEKIPLIDRQLLYTDCPAEFCDRLRQEAWGLPITTVTHPPPQHQIFLSTQENEFRSLWSLDNHFLMHMKQPEFLIGENRWHYADGGKIPFLGHTTAAGVITPTIRVSEKDPVAAKVSNLLTLRSWMNKGELTEEGPQTSNFIELIDKIISCYTEKAPSDLQKFAPSYKSGSISHRFKAHGFRDSIVVNCLMNLLTIITGETNSHRHFRETRDDFTVNYLHIFCYSAIIILLDLQFRYFHTGPHEVWTVTTPCLFCNLPIVEPPVYLKNVNYGRMTAPTLLMTHLGAAAQDLIKMAQVEYEINYPTLSSYKEEDLNITIARVIVVYECLKKAWDDRVSLSKRYGIHDMSSAGIGLISGLSSIRTEKLLGETELRALPFEAVTEVLCNYILYFYLRESYSPFKDDINARFNTLIPSTLPWYTLIEWYYKAGLLRQFIGYIHLLCQIPPHEGCYYNVNTATIYVGKNLTQYAIENPIMFPYIPATINDTVETLYKRYLSFYMRCLFTHHKVNHSDCRTRFERTQWIQLNYEDQLHVLQGYITYSRHPMGIDKFVTMVHNSQGMVEIEIQDSIEYSNDEFNSWNTKPLPGILSHFNYHHGNHMINALITFDDDTVDQILDEETGLITNLYTVAKYPIGTCIDMVRTNAYYLDKRPLNEITDDGLHIDDIDYETLPEHRPYVASIPQINDTIAPNRQHLQVFNKIEANDPNYPWSNLTRILGASISSCNKIHFILSHLDLYKYQDVQGWITCVGEGEGGILHYLLKKFPRCHGIFNTLIDDMRSGASAGICDKDITTAARYTCIPLKQGVSDLTEMTTVQIYLSHYKQKTWLMTCDADLRELNDEHTTRLWNNVVSWWLHRRTRNGILIIKVFSYKHGIILSVLSRLSYYASEVKLIKAPQSHNNLEFYICARGTARQSRVGDPVIWGIHPEIHNISQNFFQEHYAVYHQRKTEYDPGFQPASLEVLKNSIPFYDPSDGLLLYAITQKCRLPMNPSYRSIHISSEQVLRCIELSIEKEIKDILLRFTGEEHDIKTRFSASETLRHKFELINRWVFLLGLSHILNDDDVMLLLNDQRMPDRGEVLFDIIHQHLRDNKSFPVLRTGEREYKIGFYTLDVQSIIFKALGVSLQIIGIIYARNTLKNIYELERTDFNTEIEHEN